GIQTLGLKLSNESVRLLPCRGVTGDDLLVARRGSNREPISALRPYLDGAMRLIQREEGSGSAALPRLGVAIRHGETRLARLTRRRLLSAPSDPTARPGRAGQGLPTSGAA